MDRKPTLKEIAFEPIDFEPSKPTPLDADDLKLPESIPVPRPIRAQDSVVWSLKDRLGIALRTVFSSPTRAVLIATGATDPTLDEVQPTMFEGLFAGIKDWKTTILGVISATLALLARFGIDPAIDEGTMQTIATIGSVIAGGVLVFVNRKKNKAGEVE